MFMFLYFICDKFFFTQIFKKFVTHRYLYRYSYPCHAT